MALVCTTNVSMFPRAHLQSPRRSAPVGLSDCAVPAGVAIFHSKKLKVSLELDKDESLKKIDYATFNCDCPCLGTDSIGLNLK